MLLLQRIAHAKMLYFYMPSNCVYIACTAEVEQSLEIIIDKVHCTVFNFLGHGGKLQVCCMTQKH